MNITHIRNATQLISYAGKRLLIDPMLAPKGLIRLSRHGVCRTP